MCGGSPSPEVPTVRQGTHLTLRLHHWDITQVSWSSEEGDTHQPGGFGGALWRRGPMKTGMGGSNV